MAGPKKNPDYYATCLYCQASFYYPPYQRKKKKQYCSGKCSNRARKEANLVPCCNCQAPIYRPPSRKNIQTPFCSLRCHQEFNSVICQGCDKPFYRPPSQIERGRNKYCSIECYHANRPSRRKRDPDLEQQVIQAYQSGEPYTSIRKRLHISNKRARWILTHHGIKIRSPHEQMLLNRARRIPPHIEQEMIDAYLAGNTKQQVNEMFNYPRGTTDRILRNHGIQARSRSESQKGRIFSAEHRRKISENHADVSGSNNPMYGKAPGHGQWEYVDHLKTKVRSSWEATIARLLLKFNITHEYERRRFYFSDCTYLPDFYLPHHDLYIEVKGWWNQRFDKIIERMKQEKPEIRLLIIDPNNYRKIEENPEVLLTLIASMT